MAKKMAKKNPLDRMTEDEYREKLAKRGKSQDEIEAKVAKHKVDRILSEFKQRAKDRTNAKHDTHAPPVTYIV